MARRMPLNSERFPGLTARIAPSRATFLSGYCQKPDSGCTGAGREISAGSKLPVRAAVRFARRGLGIEGSTAGEIDINESISGAFSTPVVLNAFRLLFIYNGPEFGDPNEIAQLSINGGTAVGTFTVSETDNLGVWSLGGTVSNCGATTEEGSGCFDITNPFGSTPISNFSFTVVSVVEEGNNSDYSLSTVDVSAIPEPGTFLLLGSGCVLAALRARRRNHSSH
jgi:hypothetical protein